MEKWKNSHFIFIRPIKASWFAYKLSDSTNTLLKSLNQINHEEKRWKCKMRKLLSTVESM